MYSPKRNIVRRPDGLRVNVARFRGQLFVCASGCCCGRTEDGFQPVPADVYHEEWERRRLRNFVHLTIGGCLGPCALANVVLLLFDAQSLWFHSLGSPQQVWALYDYIEAMLEADGVLPVPPALAAYQFTASTGQDRPDGQPIEDGRTWRVHRSMPAPQEDPVSQVPPTGSFREEDVDLDIVRMSGAAAMPRKNGELVFDAPWQGRAFGMATALADAGLYAWDEFRDKLIARIALAERSAEPFDYYTCWLGAFESLLAEKGFLPGAQLGERAAEFEFGERDEVF